MCLVSLRYRCLYLLQEAEQIAVTPEEHVQPHLDMVSLPIDKWANLATNKWSGLVQVNLMALVQKLDGSGHACEACPYDGHLELGPPVVLRFRWEQSFWSCHTWKRSQFKISMSTWNFIPKLFKLKQSWQHKVRNLEQSTTQNSTPFGHKREQRRGLQNTTTRRVFNYQKIFLEHREITVPWMNLRTKIKRNKYCFR